MLTFDSSCWSTVYHSIDTQAHAGLALLLSEVASRQEGKQAPHRTSFLSTHAK